MTIHSTTGRDEALLVHHPDRAMSQAARDWLAVPRPMLIGGQWVPAADGRLLDVEDPATGRIVARIASGGAPEAEAAVQAAERAFRGDWARVTTAGRARLLGRLADLIMDHADVLAELESLDNGKPRHVAREVDIPFTAEVFRYYAGWATKLGGETFALALGGSDYHAQTLREPLGVAVGIIPWNFPLCQAAFKLAPALAAGCAMVLKPAEQTSLSALYLGELIGQAGFPDGTVSIVTGLGREMGEPLVLDPRVRKVSFTGSTATGKHLVRAAAASLKRLTLELGGKSPHIILADADLDRAIPAAAAAIFGNTGQVCNSGSRLFVHRSIHDRVIEGIVRIGRDLRVGAGFNPQSQIGPLMSAAQLGRVAGYVEGARASGVEVLTGGRQLGETGYFYEPTVLLGATAGMASYEEEIFGPVLCAAAFDEIDELQALADHAEYGLAAGIWTRDLSAAHRLARQIEAGAIWINCFGVFDPNLPFGGMKQSGWGRELGREGVLAYTELKSMTMKL